MMHPAPSPRAARRRGAVAVLVALCLILLMAVVAVTVDGGVLLMERRHAQAVADSAAMAGACVLYQYYPSDHPAAGNATTHTDEAKQAALDVAAANGYIGTGSADQKDGRGTTATVTVNIPPTSGPYRDRTDGFIEVIVVYQQRRYFSGILGSGTLPVKARAVARGAWTDGNIGVLILDYTGKAALNAQGNGAFTESGGRVIVNSNNPDAVVDGGNGSTIATEFDITGGLTLNGGGNLTSSPTPNQIYMGTHPVPDPLAYLPPPPVPGNGTMTDINNPTSISDLPSGIASTLDPTTIAAINTGQYNKVHILTPGQYTNLPVFGQNELVILEQASADTAATNSDYKGIYYINGGGFKSTGASIIMDKSSSGGVMIYNEPDGTQASQKIQITGNPGGQVLLSPLTNGPYQGMVLWQDRNSTVPVLAEGNGNFNVQGTFYAAAATLSINGNATGGTGYYIDDAGNKVMNTSRIGSQYVSQDLSLGGNGNVSIKYSGPMAANIRILDLVE
jgi:Flp pilus assembly protein TadG